MGCTSPIFVIRSFIFIKCVSTYDPSGKNYFFLRCHIVIMSLIILGIIYVFFSVCFFRLREERQDVERVLSMENKPRDLSSHNGKWYQFTGKSAKLLGRNFRSLYSNQLYTPHMCGNAYSMNRWESVSWVDGRKGNRSNYSSVWCQYLCIYQVFIAHKRYLI